MNGPDLLQWLPAVLTLIAWPAVVVLIVVCVLVLTPPGQQAAVLAGVADLVRAARSRSGPDAHPDQPCGVPDTPPDDALDPTGQVDQGARLGTGP